MHRRKILHVLLLAFILATVIQPFLAVSPIAAAGPSTIALTNAVRAQWDESPVLACVKDDTGQLMPGVAVTATLTSLTPNTQVLMTGANGCVSLPVKGFLSDTADNTNLGEVVVRDNPGIRIDVTVTITGPKPDVTGWVKGMDVFFSKFDINPDAARWAKDNATVFTQVAHPALLDFRKYENYGALLPIGTPVKVYGVTGDFKWAKVVVQSPGWSMNYVWFPTGALSEKWPFPPANVAQADATGYVPGTPWNWTDGENYAVVEAHRKGQRVFYVRTTFGEIYEDAFINQNRKYGRDLLINEPVTVVDITPDSRWARIEHAKGGPRYFVPTADLSVGWTDPVKGQTTVNYTVVKGDTLSRLAKHFGVSVNALVQANGIANPNLIRIGQVLVVPNPTSP